MYNDLNGILEIQVAQTAEIVITPSRVLPGKSETNPKEHIQAIMLRSGKKVEQKPQKPKIGLSTDGID